MPANPDSILDSVKKVIGFDPEYTAFDLDITMFVNGVFGNLLQIGVGPPGGFSITTNATLWSSYISRLDLLGMVKTFMCLKVKLAFDPPDGRYALPAFESQISQLEWRINVMAETAQVTFGEWWILDGLSDFPVGSLSGDFGYDTIACKAYVNGTQVLPALWWDLTGLTDFPSDALIGDLGFYPTTGEVWRKTA